MESSQRDIERGMPTPVICICMEGLCKSSGGEKVCDSKKRKGGLLTTRWKTWLEYLIFICLSFIAMHTRTRIHTNTWGRDMHTEAMLAQPFIT